MKFWSDSFADGAPIPTEFGFGRYNPDSHVELSENRNPHFAWSDLPEGTRSLVLICHDVDVPSSPDNVNKEGMTVPADLPRVGFDHWVLVDLPAKPAHISVGEFSDGVIARGKDSPGPRGTHQGLNDYTNWFAGDPDMAGKYYGYDGPCPPWNDEIVHHYHFTLYATDLEKCPVKGPFTGADVKAAIEGHVLAEAGFVGTYHIYPDAVVKR